MYKFFGKPNKVITSSISGQPMFMFNHKGEYISDDEDLIVRGKEHFDHIEIKVESIGKKVKISEKPSKITIETKGVSE